LPAFCHPPTARDAAIAGYFCRGGRQIGPNCSARGAEQFPTGPVFAPLEARPAAQPLPVAASTRRPVHYFLARVVRIGGAPMSLRRASCVVVELPKNHRPDYGDHRAIANERLRCRKFDNCAIHPSRNAKRFQQLFLATPGEQVCGGKAHAKAQRRKESEHLKGSRLVLVVAGACCGVFKIPYFRAACRRVRRYPLR
jgi:hypothetical protein